MATVMFFQITVKLYETKLNCQQIKEQIPEEEEMHTYE